MTWFYWLAWFVVRYGAKIFLRCRIYDVEKLPKKGPVIVASNHLAYADPPLVGTSMTRPVHFFAKKELFDVPILSWTIRHLNAFPVRRGVFDPQALSMVKEVLDGGGGLLMFPEGTRGDGEVLLKPKPGVGMMARKYGVTIVPVAIANSNALKRALFLRKGVSIVYGDPITPEEIMRFEDSKEGYREIAERVIGEIDKLYREARRK